MEKRAWLDTSKSKRFQIILYPLVVANAIAISGCESSNAKPLEADYRRAESLRPSDTTLAQKYERSCIACHTVKGSNAPLAGFSGDWHPRIKQGMPTLLDHARSGFKAMPARGYCNDCSDEELSALIAFMSASQSKEGV